MADPRLSYLNRTWLFERVFQPFHQVVVFDLF